MYIDNWIREKIPDFSDFFLLKCVNTDWVDYGKPINKHIKKTKIPNY